MPKSYRARPVVQRLESRTLLSVDPPGFAETQFVGALNRPTAMAFAPDGRLFVCEQGGALRVVRNGSLLSTPFASLDVDGVGERGLLGVTFDPNFATNGFVYVYYTVPNGPDGSSGAHNRISRFTAANTTGDVAAAGSERVLLELDTLSGATNHNGGAIHFGRDGKLYAATGENANPPFAQTLSNLHGKVLRLNPDGTIPADNPFFNTATGKNRAIWALGLRNPFTFSVQPGTGRLFINDVGQNTWEEVNEGAPGANYGWPGIEGPRTDQHPPAGYRDPVYAYNRVGTNECAITGGTFYNPAVGNFPSEYVGDYFFADYCGGYVKRFDPSAPPGDGQAQFFVRGAGRVVDIDVGPRDGALYYLDRGGNGRPVGVYRVNFTASQAPVITNHPDSRTVTVGQSATFSVTASGPGLRYQWQRNGENIDGATASSYTLSSAQLSDSGAQFRVVVSNDFGSAVSNAATLTVSENRAPTGTIATPAAGTIYRAGQTIGFSGSGSDPEDGALPASRFSWDVVFHHADHTHDFRQFSGVTGGSFTIPNTGEVAPNVFYRINLTVRDAQGRTHTTSRDVRPKTASIILATNPTGLQLKLDGSPVTADTPAAIVNGVSGMRRTIEAPSTQTRNGVPYQFVSWSDGGARVHTITTPDADRTYTATYRVASNGLRATYFNNKDFTGTSVSRIDPTINFDWGSGSPVPGTIDVNTFSARWTGQVQPQFSQTYTFRASTDDGVKVWVDGRVLIDRLGDAPVDSRGSITLVAGRKYNIRVDYLENFGSARARLLWSSASQPEQVIPSGRLFPATTVGATADAGVRGGTSAGTNFGQSTELLVKNHASSEFVRQSFLKFDLSGVSSIGSATLRLFGRVHNGAASSSVRVGAFSVAGTSWTESGLTWNNRPASGSTALSSATVTGPTNGWYELDLTAYLRQEKAAGRNVVAIVLKALTTSDPYVAFNSAEASSSRPELVVTA